ncbi:hypothetical protein COU59_03840 [Candidatus Pacearchaeota archaeon CG10_big_fil_rev_8_21_14_0_10_34_12]|nr:MAG: hypothetical protein COU59_03840 [Candidatus Pacearchaeota archaeon CG10_big_fil_rev_8_21_14_0_10_34_12]
MKGKKLFDIFAKKNAREKVKIIPTIIADYREKNSLVSSELVGLGLQVSFRELKIGDFAVKDVILERKTVGDFISSMKNGRLVKQLENLQKYKKKILMIEGIDEQELYTENYYENKEGMHPNSVRGFLLSVILKYNIPIIFTKDYKDTAKFISILSKRTEKEASLNVTRKSFNKKEQMQFIIEGFPGIGPKTAKKLLEEFKTIKGIINTPTKELEKLIGKKAEIFRIVDDKY